MVLQSGSFIATVIKYIISIWLTLGVVRFSIHATAENPHAKIKDMFMEYHPQMWLRYFVLSVISGIAVFIGTLLLVVPGIYLAMRLMMYRYALVHKREPIIDTLKLSWAMTKGHAWKLFLFTLVMIAINLVGLLALGIGLLVTIPVTGFASVYVYRELLDIHEAKLPKQVEETAPTT